jgi:predicted enzyme related to lactoylglutathione lyase
MTETTMRVHGIDAAYYMTKDLDVSTKFYNELLGIEPTVHVPGMLSEYTFPDGESFGIYQSSGFYESGTVMFRVDDVPEFVKAAIARGVAFSGDGFVDETPGCHMAFGVDPDNNKFIIHKRK